MAAPKGNKNHFKHGLSHTRIDNIYKGMISRCYHPQNIRFDRYGGRGITVCDEWRNDKIKFFEWAFANGYTDDLTIDRINGDKGYSPDNCRWKTQKAQQNNRCNNRQIELNGETHTMAEWADITGLNPSTIWARLKRGWSAEEALKVV